MISIRAADKSDAQLIFDFIVELAVYEKAREQVRTTVAELEQTLFGANAVAKALICQQDNEPAGYAIWFYNYSTWLGKKGIYLEDLYVSPRFRGNGCGKALMRHIADIAVKENCGRFEWSVLDWNKPAIEFYESAGARPQSEWIIYRLAGPALQDFAKKD